MSGFIDLTCGIENLWGLRVLFQAVAEGKLSLIGADGSSLDLPISAVAQDAARRWLKISLGFLAAADEPLIDAEIILVLREVFGSEVLAALVQPSAFQTGMLAVLDPALETVLLDEIVLTIPRLYFARARRLAEGGDLRGALEWLGRLPRLRPAASAAEIYELIAVLTAVTHAMFDQGRLLREALRANADRLDRDFVVETLLGIVCTAEVIVERILQLGPGTRGVAGMARPPRRRGVAGDPDHAPACRARSR